MVTISIQANTVRPSVDFRLWWYRLRGRNIKMARPSTFLESRSWWGHDCGKQTILKGPQNTFQNSIKNLLIFDTNFNIQCPVEITWFTPLSRSFCIFRRCNFHLHRLLSRTMVDYVQLECNDNIFFSDFSFRMWKGKHSLSHSHSQIVALHQYFHSLEKNN